MLRISRGTCRKKFRFFQDVKFGICFLKKRDSPYGGTPRKTWALVRATRLFHADVDGIAHWLAWSRKPERERRFVSANGLRRKTQLSRNQFLISHPARVYVYGGRDGTIDAFAKHLPLPDSLLFFSLVPPFPSFFVSLLCRVLHSRSHDFARGRNCRETRPPRVWYYGATRTCSRSRIELTSG